MKDKERQTSLTQNLQSQCLEAQLQLQKIKTERDDLKKRLAESEAEKADMMGKFEQFGTHLSEQHQLQMASLAEKQAAQAD